MAFISISIAPFYLLSAETGMWSAEGETHRPISDCRLRVPAWPTCHHCLPLAVGWNWVNQEGARRQNEKRNGKFRKLFPSLSPIPSPWSFLHIPNIATCTGISKTPVTLRVSLGFFVLEFDKSQCLLASF